MRPLRFWSLFLALAASATALFPRIAEARPGPSIAGETGAGVKPRPSVARPIIVKIGRAYRAEIHARPRCIPKGKPGKRK